MKLVNEHINEKFVEDSDPIHDMGIGIIQKIKKFCDSKDESSNSLDEMLLCCVDHKKYKYVEYLLENGANAQTGHIYQIENARKYGNLPMRYAIFNRDVKMGKLLLKYGASIKKAMIPNELHMEPFKTIIKNILQN